MQSYFISLKTLLNKMFKIYLEFGFVCTRTAYFFRAKIKLRLRFDYLESIMIVSSRRKNIAPNQILNYTVCCVDFRLYTVSYDLFSSKYILVPNMNKMFNWNKNHVDFRIFLRIVLEISKEWFIVSFTFMAVELLLSNFINLWNI